MMISYIQMVLFYAGFVVQAAGRRRHRRAVVAKAASTAAVRCTGDFEQSQRFCDSRTSLLGTEASAFTPFTSRALPP